MKYPRKNNLTGTCGICRQPCSRNAKKCELCNRPNRMPQRSNGGMTVTNTNLERVLKQAIQRIKKTTTI